MVSADTMRARTAEAAVEAGASMINDVSGGLSDPHMPDFIASARVPYVLMHWRGYSHDMQRHAIYTDVAGEVATELQYRMEAVVDRGVDPSLIILDPGLGFAKTAEHNWSLLARLSLCVPKTYATWADVLHLAVGSVPRLVPGQVGGADLAEGATILGLWA
jgi:dihydropteroate synthase